MAAVKRLLSLIAFYSAKAFERFLPDAFIIVILLTFFVFLVGITWVDQSPMQMIHYWGNGFWRLLEFSMQMVLVLLMGHTIAASPLVQRVLSNGARRVKSATAAIFWVTVISLAASWLNWGFGLVVGAFLARELSKHVAKVDYPLLIASAYSGFVVWHGGLSGSVPLAIATQGHLNEATMGVVPVSATIFSGYNLGIIAVIFMTLPWLNTFMQPEAPRCIDPQKLSPKSIESTLAKANQGWLGFLESSRLLGLLLGALAILFVAAQLLRGQFDLNLNSLNFIFFFAAIALHGSIVQFLRAIDEAIKTTSSIVVQFPMYAGLMGMVTESGLAVELSQGFVKISSTQTLPFFTFLSAGFLNIFIPSGGGQWAVQSQVMLPAAIELKADLGRTAMAIAWGDAWTNLIQPFWALPALAVAGLKPRDIMGFCLLSLIFTGTVIGLGFLFL